MFLPEPYDIQEGIKCLKGRLARNCDKKTAFWVFFVFKKKNSHDLCASTDTEYDKIFVFLQYKQELHMAVFQTSQLLTGKAEEWPCHGFFWGKCSTFPSLPLCFTRQPQSFGSTDWLFLGLTTNHTRLNNEPRYRGWGASKTAGRVLM